MENKEKIDSEEEVWEDLTDTSIEEERGPPTSSSSSSERHGFGKALSDEDAYSETIPEKKKRGQTYSDAREETVKKWPWKKKRSGRRRRREKKNLQGDVEHGKKNLQGDIEDAKKNLQGDIEDAKKPPKKRRSNLP